MFSTKIFSFRNRVVIIIVGFIIGLSSLLFTNNMAKQLREKEQNEVRMWSFAMSKMGEVGPENQILRYILNANTNIPFIITTGTLEVIKPHLIPDRILKNPVLLRQKLEQMAAANPIMEIKTWSNDTFYLFMTNRACCGHWSTSPIFNWLSFVFLPPSDTSPSVLPNRMNRTVFGSDWPKRRPTNWGLQPPHFSVGSNICALNPSTKQQSKR